MAFLAGGVDGRKESASSPCEFTVCNRFYTFYIMLTQQLKEGVCVREREIVKEKNCMCVDLIT